MIDGLMKSVFKFAGFTQEQAKEMIDGTYKVVQSIGNDMAALKANMEIVKAKLDGKKDDGKTDN